MKPKVLLSPLTVDDVYDAKDCSEVLKSALIRYVHIG